MSITRVKSWTAGEVLTANDLNNEFNNITDSVLAEPFVATQPLDLNGQVLILDADGDTLLDPSTNNVIDITIGGADDFRFSANTFTALAGSSIVVQQGDMTVSDGDVVISSGRVLEADAGSISSTSAITVPDTGHSFTITGITTIASFSATQVGVILYVRFTGAGLNLTYNATSFISPWGRDYRTVQNEVLCFLSLGSGNYTFWSMNGPKERVGVTIEANVSSPPPGYLEETGTASRTTYPGLFVELGSGSIWGVGNGTTTFDLPSTRGLTVINQDPLNSVITSASTNGANAATLGGKGGAETHTLTESEVPPLSVPAGTNLSGGTSTLVKGANTGITTITVVNTSGGDTHSNTPPWIAKKKYIRF